MPFQIKQFRARQGMSKHVKNRRFFLRWEVDSVDFAGEIRPCYPKNTHTNLSDRFGS